MMHGFISILLDGIDAFQGQRDDHFAVRNILQRCLYIFTAKAGEWHCCLLINLCDDSGSLSILVELFSALEQIS